MSSQHAVPTLRMQLSRFWAQQHNRTLIAMAAVFVVLYAIPFGTTRVTAGVNEAFEMVHYYAREHVLYSLVPAFFIAGAISVFLDKQSVIRYLGPDAKMHTAYGVASVSGAVLSVCSCTILPLFKGIYKKGAGIGPAVAFLYSGPAINVLAVILTAQVLGVDLGIARAVGAIIFAVVIGFAMHLLYRKEDAERQTNAAMFQGVAQDESDANRRPLWKTVVYMGSMIGILLFLNWQPSDGALRFWDMLYEIRYVLVAVFAVVLAYSLIRWFRGPEIRGWVEESRNFTIQILPLLLGGIFIAGFLLGRPGEEALIPEAWIENLVGTNSPLHIAFASVAGAFMYFATLTEVPILEGLMGAGMADGPALALLLGGPSMSLPSLLVIRSVLGIKKTALYLGLVVVMSTLSGMLYAGIVA
ncbi:MAG: permease [Spirochaetales bacterium]